MMTEVLNSNTIIKKDKKHKKDKKDKKDKKVKKSYSFQILDWREQVMEKESWQNFYKDNNHEIPYSVFVYGRTDKNKSISVKITGYKPFFYFEVPREWDESKAQLLMACIKNNVRENFGDKISDGFDNYEVIESKKFYGFTAEQNFKFIKISFKNAFSYSKFTIWLENNKINNEGLFDVPTQLQIFESKIKPFMRLMHIREINASGWVKIDKYKKSKDINHTCDINLEADWLNVVKQDINNVQKFIIASFDIECYSDTGNFPNAGGLNEETGENVEGDPLIQIGTVFSYCGEDEPFYKNIITLNKCEINSELDGIDVKCFDDEASVILEWTNLIKKMNPDAVIGYNIDGFDFEYLFKRAKKYYINTEFLKLSKKTNILSKYDETELKSSAMGQNMLKHIEIDGRVVVDVMKYLQKNPAYKLDNYKLDNVVAHFIRESINVTKGNILNITCHENKTWISTTNIDYLLPQQEIYLTYIVDGFEKIHDVKYTVSEILEYDGEIIGKDEVYKFYVNGTVPQTLLTTYGDKLGWKRSIQYEYKNNNNNNSNNSNNSNNNNNNNIDVNNIDANNIDKNDINKNDINKNDDVSENDNASENGDASENDNISKNDDTSKTENEHNNVKHTTIYTTSIYGIYEGQYLHILYNDGLTDNVHEQKYKIEKIIKDPITFTINKKNVKIYQIIVDNYIPEFIFENNNETYWCISKDDLPPNKIFEYHRGTNAQRSIIAKYCIQDCVLVTKLFEKLRILIEAIGMANVCHVPVSYIFYRGQSIKIQSLVYKECRDENTLIPTLYPNKKINELDEDDEEEEEDSRKKGYEGATVLTPQKGVHYQPIIVLDFRSLYSRSMKMGNVSHEMSVQDKQYLNHPDYTYYSISFKNNDGTYTKCTYAKHKSGKLGIIPKILSKLLDKREEVKGMMKKAESEFLKNIFDGLQNAYKVTANSIYGQIGAPVSSIYFRELAASTTAIGRKMLQYAKKFVETIFVHLVNRSRHNLESYILFANKVFENSELDRFVAKTKDKAGNVKILYSNKEEFYEYFKNNVHKLITTEQKISPKVIYGDSVTGETPLLLKKDDKIYIKTIETICDDWMDYNNFKPDHPELTCKEQNKNITDYEVWTNNNL